MSTNTVVRSSERLHNFIFIASGVALLLTVLLREALFSSSTGSRRAKSTNSALHDLIAEAELARQRRTISHIEQLAKLVKGDPEFIDLTSILPSNHATRPDLSVQWNAAAFYALPWEHVNSRDNVDTYSKAVPGSKLVAFRGVSLMDVHISATMGPFANVSHSLEWVNVLQDIQRLELLSSSSYQATIDSIQNITERKQTVDLIYQVLSLPWPISPRDILLLRHSTFDPHKRQITMRYCSVEDDRRPAGKKNSDGRTMIRALSPHTLWRFTAVDDEDTTIAPSAMQSTQTSTPTDSRHSLQVSQPRWRFSLRRLWDRLSHWSKSMWSRLVPNKSRTDTKTVPVQAHKPNATEKQRRKSQKVLVEVETVVDSRGSIPFWFINFMQRHWPSQTLSTFRNLAKAGKMPEYGPVSAW